MRTFWVYISRIWGEETPERIASKFCVVIGTQDVITCIKFGDDRLRDFWLAGGQSLPSPIDFAGRPYNSATLPQCYATACTVILERLVLTRLMRHLLSSANFSHYQLAYRTDHLTETALLEVLDGVYTVADDKQISVLISLDLSAAFDTIDHLLLIKCLQSEFGVTNISLDWLRSYLVDPAQFVKMGQHQSDTVPLDVDG